MDTRRRSSAVKLNDLDKISSILKNLIRIDSQERVEVQQEKLSDYRVKRRESEQRYQDQRREYWRSSSRSSDTSAKADAAIRKSVSIDSAYSDGGNYTDDSNSRKNSVRQDFSFDSSGLDTSTEDDSSESDKSKSDLSTIPEHAESNSDESRRHRRRSLIKTSSKDVTDPERVKPHYMPAKLVESTTEQSAQFVKASVVEGIERTLPEKAAQNVQNVQKTVIRKFTEKTTKIDTRLRNKQPARNESTIVALHHTPRAHATATVKKPGTSEPEPPKKITPAATAKVDVSMKPMCVFVPPKPAPVSILSKYLKPELKPSALPAVEPAKPAATFALPCPGHAAVVMHRSYGTTWASRIMRQLEKPNDLVVTRTSSKIPEKPAFLEVKLKKIEHNSRSLNKASSSREASSDRYGRAKRSSMEESFNSKISQAFGVTLRKVERRQEGRVVKMTTAIRCQAEGKKRYVPSWRRKHGDKDE